VDEAVAGAGPTAYHPPVGLISWIVVGLIAGMVAGRVTGRRVGCAAKVGVGVLGALIGGALARAAGFEGVRRFGLHSLLLAAVGATLLLLLLDAIEQRPGARRR
jgi:uncharacterized membrane protein YeaQ/YmgE (transglycosylase-associated protein family)